MPDVNIIDYKITEFNAMLNPRPNYNYKIRISSEAGVRLPEETNDKSISIDMKMNITSESAEEFTINAKAEYIIEYDESQDLDEFMRSMAMKELTGDMQKKINIMMESMGHPPINSNAY